MWANAKCCRLAEARPVVGKLRGTGIVRLPTFSMRQGTDLGLRAQKLQNRCESATVPPRCPLRQIAAVAVHHEQPHMRNIGISVYLLCRSPPWAFPPQTWAVRSIERPLLF